VLAWAALRQRAWYHHGAPIPPPRPGQARPEMELRPEPLPAQEDWDRAVERAGRLFGVVGTPYLTAPAAAELTERVRTQAAAVAAVAADLVGQLESAYSRLGLDPAAPTGRLASARAAAALVATLSGAGDRVRLVETLARAHLPGTDTAIAASISSARTLGPALAGYRWDRLGPLLDAEAAADEPGRSAARILATLRDAVSADEISARLKPALDAADDELFTWLAHRSPVPPPVVPPPTARPPVAPLGVDDVHVDVPAANRRGQRVRGKGAPAEPVLDELRRFLTEHPDEIVVVDWRVQE
jgi:hypothetical protein